MLNVFISSVCQSQTRPCRQFYNMPRLSKLSLSVGYSYNRLIAGGKKNCGRERSRTAVQTDYFIHTVHFFVNVLMISQNIRFKPFYVRSKTFLRHSWLITPLGDILCLRALRIWLKTYRNPHDTKILRGLYSVFLIHFAGFKLAPAN